MYKNVPASCLVPFGLLHVAKSIDLYQNIFLLTAYQLGPIIVSRYCKRKRYTRKSTLKPTMKIFVLPLKGTLKVVGTSGKNVYGCLRGDPINALFSSDIEILKKRLEVLSKVLPSLSLTVVTKLKSL